MAVIKLKRGAVLLAAVLTAAPASVFAGFEWKGSGTQPEAALSRPAGGFGPAALFAAPAAGVSGNEVVSGFGSALPLAIALHQVIPSGSMFSLEPGVSSDTPVSWEGGKPWQQVLAAMLSPRGLGFRLQNNAVIIGRSDGREKSTPSSLPSGAAYQALPPVALTKPAPQQSRAAQGQDSAPPAAAAPTVVPPPASGATWMAHKGRTLKEVLADWAKTAGVDVYWSIDYDYRLNDSTAYGGSFEDAVASLLNLFTEVRPQPYGQLHLGDGGPRALVISSYDLQH